mmetsp:Transcript_26366/g.37153  ORF Transcript_26366/g.37153 Transcript_26366/m.37153 type:complete len:96 (+) Transcript_26366:536-823(+)
MSATAKYRQQRRVSKAATTNPSSLSLPINKPKSEHPYVREITPVAKRRESKSSDEADKTEIEPKRGSGVFWVTTAIGVAGGAAYAYTVFGTNLPF